MNIVVVEDHLIVREAIRRACHESGEATVVGETGSGAAAIELVRRRKPDAVILDLGLDDVDGFVVAERVLALAPAVKVIVFSGRIDDFTILRVNKLGLHGFLDKNTNTMAMIVEALRAVKAGKTYFSPAFQMFRDSRQADSQSALKLLTETELRVLALIGQGLTDEAIGHEFGIAPSSAQTHRSNILRKLGIESTPKLVAFAIRHGFAGVGKRWG
jgi:two-component system response regulator NreC